MNNTILRDLEQKVALPVHVNAVDLGLIHHVHDSLVPLCISNWGRSDSAFGGIAAIVFLHVAISSV